MEAIKATPVNAIVYANDQSFSLLECYRSMIPDNGEHFIKGDIQDIHNTWIVDVTGAVKFKKGYTMKEPTTFMHATQLYTPNQMKNGVIILRPNQNPLLHYSPEESNYMLVLTDMFAHRKLADEILNHSATLAGKRSMVICYIKSPDWFRVSESGVRAFIVDATTLKAGQTLTSKQIKKSNACLLSLYNERTLTPEESEHNQLVSHTRNVIESSPMPRKQLTGQKVTTEDMFHLLCNYHREECSEKYYDRKYDIEYEFTARKRQKTE